MKWLFLRVQCMDVADGDGVVAVELLETILVGVLAVKIMMMAA